MTMFKRGQPVETDGFDLQNQQYWEPATVVRRSTAKDCREDGPESFKRGEWYLLRWPTGKIGLWTHESRIRAAARPI